MSELNSDGCTSANQEENKCTTFVLLTVRKSARPGMELILYLSIAITIPERFSLCLRVNMLHMNLLQKLALKHYQDTSASAIRLLALTPLMTRKFNMSCSSDDVYSLYQDIPIVLTPAWTAIAVDNGNGLIGIVGYFSLSLATSSSASSTFVPCNTNNSLMFA